MSLNLSRIDKPAMKAKTAAWAVHVFTASGAVLGFLALLAILNGDKQLVFFWLGLALFVDGIDGTLARRAKVREVTPQVDGTTLDNVIDYFTYVAVPAMLVYWFGLVPTGWETVAAATIMAVSCYTFANAEMKTHDYYFSGFPALWNVVVLAFFILQTDPWTNVVVIAVCCLLTFIPLKYVHPFRVPHLRSLNIPMTVVWAFASIWLVAVDPDTTDLPAEEPMIYWIWVLSSLYFVGLSLWRSFRKERGATPAP
ncbi:CDP-alcohol phosphatidyltransferase family protein [Algihabitans sp.]|uniref:CDP-alcohol phosphatidyltransferase family protein n=1 Tax=Algihabitans sp. TaxID=2821514 RepID=UPI003BA896C8